MFNKVKEVKPLQDYMLLVTFINGEQRLYDVKPLFDKFLAFNDLKVIPGLFELVKVEQGGYAVVWNDNIDLACDELYHNGISLSQNTLIVS